MKHAAIILFPLTCGSKIKKREIDPTKNAWSYNMGASDFQIQMTCSSGVIMYTKNKNNKRRENVQMT